MADDLVGVVMVHVESAAVIQVIARKEDDSGWWVAGGGGLTDGVITDGTWVPLATVLAHWRATNSPRTEAP